MAIYTVLDNNQKVKVFKNVNLLVDFLSEINHENSLYFDNGIKYGISRLKELISFYSSLDLSTKTKDKTLFIEKHI